MRPVVLSVSCNLEVWPSREAALAQSGFAVTHAATLEDALDIARDNIYSAVLIGHCFSPQQQKQFVHQVRKFSSVPVVCMYRLWLENDVGADAYVGAFDGPAALATVVAGVTRTASVPQQARMQKAG